MEFLFNASEALPNVNQFISKGGWCVGGRVFTGRNVFIPLLHHMETFLCSVFAIGTGCIRGDEQLVYVSNIGIDGMHKGREHFGSWLLTVDLDAENILIRRTGCAGYGSPTDTAQFAEALEISSSGKFAHRMRSLPCHMGDGVSHAPVWLFSCIHRTRLYHERIHIYT
jgi:hypothetical protein